jgi:hypothetical protein
MGELQGEKGGVRRAGIYYEWVKNNWLVSSQNNYKLEVDEKHGITFLALNDFHLKLTGDPRTILSFCQLHTK